MLRSLRIASASLLIVGPMAAQSPGTQGPPPAPRLQTLDAAENFSGVNMQARQVKLLNDQRQKVIVAASDKILQLARELNADATSQNRIFSTAECMHKAEKIEKLAKTVREKMTNAVGVTPPPNSYGPWDPSR